eukprot:TRINITY_DN15712_c0_g1_i1.p1 TRINITY_DN15712_c0_g1~~TRINITY_DN15712_c0_g1_i1.p1  ORF type:complete len:296 (+),score=81.24 TRINITY_DN15712_c0_g1_i1:85-972(+)
MQRGLVGSEMCIRDRYQRRVHGAVEGGVGSEVKLDSFYLSPQIDIASRVSFFCDDYELPILLTDSVYNLFTAKVKAFLRKVDVVLVSELKDPFGIYTFDMSEDTIEAHEEHKIGDIIPLEEYSTANLDAYKEKSADFMFIIDADIASLHRNADEIMGPYRDALASFISGDWEQATDLLELCVGVWPSDGPTKVLQNFIVSYNYTAPEEWRGYRNIDEPLPTEFIQEIQEDNNPEGKTAPTKEAHNTPKPESPTARKKTLIAIEEKEEEDEDVSNQLISTIFQKKKKKKKKKSTLR